MSFPTQTQWVSHWPKDLAAHKAQAKASADDGAGGIIIFTSWHNDAVRGGYNIPPHAADRKAIFDAYRAAGLQVYAATYNLDLGNGEVQALSTILQSYEFDGVIIDVETEWEHVPLDGATKRQRINDFCGAANQLVGLVGYAPSWAPDDHGGIRYSDFNAVTDLVMPQIYWEGFHISDTGQGAYNAFRAHWAAGSAAWDHQPKLVVPIDDPHYGSASRAKEIEDEVREFNTLIVQQFGHISHWYIPFEPAIRRAIKTTGTTTPVPCPAGYQRNDNGVCVPIPTDPGDPGNPDPGNPFIDPTTGELSTGVVTAGGFGAISGVLIGGAIVAAVVVVLALALKGHKAGESVLPHLRHDAEGA